MVPAAGAILRGQAGLNLAPERTAKFKEMREAQWKEMKPLREQCFTKRDEIRKLWLEPDPDQEKIAAAQKEMRSLRDQIQDKMTAIRLEALKTLTPEQQDKIRSSFSGAGLRPAARYGTRRLWRRHDEGRRMARRYDGTRR